MGPLRWSGVGGLRRLPRATITDLKDRSGGTGGKTLGTRFFACGRKRGRRTKKKINLTQERKSNLRESRGKRNRTLRGENTNQTGKPSYRGVTAKGGGDNPGTVMRGKSGVKTGKETHREQERRDPWRTDIGLA